MEEALFYVGQKALIEKDGKVLIVFDPIFGLDFPGGKIQEDEIQKPGDLELSLKREVREETGFEIEVKNPFAVWFFEISKKTHPLYGKKVYIILFRTKYISGDLKLSEEHNKFEWADQNNFQKFDKGNDGFIALQKYFSGK